MNNISINWLDDRKEKLEFFFYLEISILKVKGETCQFHFFIIFSQNWTVDIDWNRKKNCHLLPSLPVYEHKLLVA